MIRIGADYSAAKKGMDGANRELSRFKRETERTTSAISGRNGLGGLRDSFRNVSSSVTSSLSEIRGANGLGGVVAGLAALRPAVGTAVTSLRGLGAAAGGVASAMGPIGVAAGVATAAIGVLTAAVAAASQEAVRFEANIGRLNMQLKTNSREFMSWARSVGLAKSTAADMGATYGTLLSSFIRDSNALAEQTQQIVQATRVVASATGRSIEDVTERMRSGLLGNTEAIEDLGIFVNVSMIESTNAFRRFAGDKSWEQIDFQLQQQIRLAAILEQAYARYGNELQQNVMTKQTILTEQLKDIKLHLSQAFLPIWDAVLPALIELAKWVSRVTESIARLMYWLRGWDYDEMTQGMDESASVTDDLSKGVGDLGDAYKETGKQAKKARAELAAFDRLNLLGSGGGVDKGGSGGGSGSVRPGTPGSPKPGGNGGGWNLPDLPPLPELQLRFKPPIPPDMGIGAVVTTVVSTVNQLVKEIQAKIQAMWDSLRAQAGAMVPAIKAQWDALLNGMRDSLGAAIPNLQAQWDQLWSGLQGKAGAVVPQIKALWDGLFAGMGMTAGTFIPELKAQWDAFWEGLRAGAAERSPSIVAVMAKMWADMRASTSTNAPLITTAAAALFDAILAKARSALPSVSTLWNETLSAMNARLNEWRPYMEWGWHLIAAAVRNVINPLQDLQKAWYNGLAYLQKVINGYQPTLVAAWSAIAAAIKGLNSPLDDLRARWNNTLQSMYNSALSWINGIVGKVNDAISAISRLRQALNNQPASVPSPSPSPSPKTDTGRAPWVDQAPVLGDIYAGLDWLQKQTEGFANSIGQFVVPGAAGSGAANLGRGAAAQAGKLADDFAKWLKGLNWGSLVPHFAAGGVVYGPTLGMMGEYPGARSNPEVIAPLSELQSIMDESGNSREVVNVLRQILTAVKEGKNVQAVISQNEVASAAIRGINDETRRTGRNPLTI